MTPTISVNSNRERTAPAISQRGMSPLTGIRNALILYNPLSGRRRQLRVPRLREACRILKEAGIEAELEATTGRGSAVEQARAAVRRGCELVIACGGDGTVNEVVNGLARSQVPMAVLPAGTANVLAKELSLPWSIPRAAREIPRGQVRRIALGLATSPERPELERFFICMGGVGPDGSMVYAVEMHRKPRLGVLAYWIEGVRHIFTYPFPAFRVETGERTLEATLVIAGRTKHYGGPVKITDRASLLENSFELLAVTASSRLRYVRNFLLLLVGIHHGLRENSFWKTARVHCSPVDSAAVYVQVDGEPIGRLPVEFRVVPEAMSLVVPERAKL